MHGACYYFGSTSGRIFKISRFIPDGFIQIKSRVRGNQARFDGVSAILQSGLILEDIRRMFFVKIHVHCPGSPDWQQTHSSNVHENLTRSQNGAYTTRKILIFLVLCALFEQIPFGMNKDILKNPTLCGAKNSNRLRVPSHLVTWSPHTDTMAWL